MAEHSDIPPITDAENSMEADKKPAAPHPKLHDESFVDDEELQAALAQQRRSKLKRSFVKLTYEESARRGENQ